MTLSKCAECGKVMVSGRVAACPGCGAPVATGDQAPVYDGPGKVIVQNPHDMQVPDSVRFDAATSERPQPRENSPMGWYIEAWRNALDFRGRASRPEFWYYTLFYWLGLLLGVAFGDAVGDALGSLWALWFFASFVPSLSVAVRRLRDTGRSGWLILLSFVPLAGLCVWWWCSLPSDTTVRESTLE